MDKKATLTLADGKSLDFPVLSGSIGPEVIDIRTLYGKSGMFTYDPGFLSTASCNSSITYIDGDAGVLLYRGYPIEQLAQLCDFLVDALSQLGFCVCGAHRRAFSVEQHLFHGCLARLVDGDSDCSGDQSHCVHGGNRAQDATTAAK